MAATPDLTFLAEAIIVTFGQYDFIVSEISSQLNGSSSMMRDFIMMDFLRKYENFIEFILSKD
jgi:hypothetical protein